MAQLKGPFFFTGSIGNIRAYYNRTLKRYVLALKGGSTKEMIENNPAFARQRENMSEFKACALWASQLRKSLISIAHLFQGYYFSDIVAMGKSIQKHDDDHVKGKRYLESSKDARLLTTLNFNRDHPFDRVLTHQYDILFSGDKQTVTLKMLGFKSFSRINWPTRVDSYRIVLVIAQLSDIVWGDAEERYLPVVLNMERLSVTSFSEWRQSSTDLIDIILTASFAQPALQKPGTTVVVALGIDISTSSKSSSPGTLSGYGTMKIVDCFV